MYGDRCVTWPHREQHEVWVTRTLLKSEPMPEYRWFVCACVCVQWEELRSLATSCRRRSRAEWLSGQILLGDVSSSRGRLRFLVGDSPVRIMLLISWRRWGVRGQRSHIFYSSTVVVHSICVVVSVGVCSRWGGCCRCSSKSCPEEWLARGRSLSCEVRCRWNVYWTKASDEVNQSSGWGTGREGGTPPIHTHTHTHDVSSL